LSYVSGVLTFDLSSPVSECNSSGYAKCCDTVTNSSDPQVTKLAGLLGVVVSALDGDIGLNCLDIVGSTWYGVFVFFVLTMSLSAYVTYSSSQSVCCNGNKADGLINIQCVNLIL
jgi:Fungal hydrophobin